MRVDGRYTDDKGEDDNKARDRDDAIAPRPLEPASLTIPISPPRADKSSMEWSPAATALRAPPSVMAWAQTRRPARVASSFTARRSSSE